MERSSSILLLVMVGLILLILIAGYWWIHSTDTTPKAPLHSSYHLRPKARIQRFGTA
jgi:hypothetical protein